MQGFSHGGQPLPQRWLLPSPPQPRCDLRCARVPGRFCNSNSNYSNSNVGPCLPAAERSTTSRCFSTMRLPGTCRPRCVLAAVVLRRHSRRVWSWLLGPGFLGFFNKFSDVTYIPVLYIRPAAIPCRPQIDPSTCCVPQVEYIP